LNRNPPDVYCGNVAIAPSVSVTFSNAALLANVSQENLVGRTGFGPTYKLNLLERKGQV
jgi:hypothetical protein